MKEIAATIPSDFLYFILKKIMSNTIVAEEGEIYQKESIECYFAAFVNSYERNHAGVKSRGN